MASATCLDKSSRLASLLPGGRCGFSDVLGKGSRLASLLRGGAAASATYWEKARDLRRSYGAPTWLQRRTWKMARGWRRRPKRLHSHVGAARAASLSSCSAVITPSCCRRKRWRCDDGPCARGGAVIWRRWRTWGKARGSRRSYRGPARLQRCAGKKLAARAAPTGFRRGFSDVLGKSSRLAPLLQGPGAASVSCRSGASREPFVLSRRDHAYALHTTTHLVTPLDSQTCWPCSS